MSKYACRAPSFLQPAAFPLFEEIWTCILHLSIGADEYLSGSRNGHLLHIRCSVYYIFKYQLRTWMVYVPCLHYGFFSRLKALLVLYLKVDYRRHKACTEVIFVPYTLIVLAKLLSTIFQIEDIRSVPRHLHHIYFRETDRKLMTESQRWLMQLDFHLR